MKGVEGVCRANSSVRYCTQWAGLIVQERDRKLESAREHRAQKRARAIQQTPLQPDIEHLRPGGIQMSIDVLSLGGTKMSITL